MHYERLLEFRQQVRCLLKAIGEDCEREGLLKTPDRYLKALAHLTHGYHLDDKVIVESAIYEIVEAKANELVLVRDIEFYSLCEHHLLPFYGRMHVGYIPDKQIIGLSKIPRLVECFSRRLQVQERLTAQVASSLMEHLKPLGVGVVCEAGHLCMQMRGVEKQGALAQTSVFLGVMKQESWKRNFFQLVR